MDMEGICKKVDFKYIHGKMRQAKIFFEYFRVLIFNQNISKY